ncbi:helix-turn-helix domain-containing protein [Altererythrobacter ishigakiensis]|uniref:Transcriptional regulator with XRE-family HTH domain n=1 Tax=Altererythrobacter ishigakiensis TaxID=476157 RepID=A0A562UUE6_9SPHN|nr:helix-turn-helix domain-containing protein [Altererythrobacter ishigakiensis]TWJ09239.1 transcriptional regulator with XRE-family HTH domain [Altererythrobacter ishigakiensis]
MSIRAHMDELLVSDDRRNGNRIQLYLATRGLLPEGKQANVEIHNISVTGLLLETNLPLNTGSRLDVDLPHSGPTGARVVWVGDGVFGCAFDQPISEAELGAVQLKSEAPLPPTIGQTQAANSNVTFGKKLEQLRKARGLTLANVADALDVSKPTVWAWEKGKARPLDERFPAIAEALGVEIDELAASTFTRGWTAVIEESRDSIASALGLNKDQVKIMLDL